MADVECKSRRLQQRLAQPEAICEIPSTVSQLLGIPPVVPTITEDRQQSRICARCGETVLAPLLAAVSRSAFGPRLRALVATLVADSVRHRPRRSATP